MNDARIFQIRNALMVSFAVLGLLVMWGNVVGVTGALSVLVHLLLLVNVGGLVYFIRITGVDTLMTTPLAMILIGLMAVASIARFIYAMSYGD
ncbi:MAG: hypothetical protein IPK83_07085 [Planctomycetes bacterium]|nr:hypothetical protein [Planctomycetota bacterium]